MESKSVARRVRINEYGEWERLWNGVWSGIPSPIKQAGRQGSFLRDILQEHRESLHNKVLFGLKQGGFLTMQIDVLASISDSGAIERPRGTNALPEVCKADQTADHIQQIHSRYKKSESSLRLRDIPYTLHQDEISRISSFLVQRHSPGCRKVASEKIGESGTSNSCESASPFPAMPSVQHTIPVSPMPAHSETAVMLRCRPCQATGVKIVYGRYGYYIKCLSCDKKTPLNRTCKHCGGKVKTRKEGQKFFAECASRTTSYPFHENAHG